MRLLYFALEFALIAAGQTRTVVAIAHRGEHLHHPENTIPAFQEAMRVGADFFEVDLRTTADGKLILSHDESVNRCTSGQGKVSELTYSQVRALDAGIKMGPAFAGTRMPSFDEALDLARAGKSGIYVDVKSASAAELVSHIDAHGMTERVVIYCGMKLAREVVAISPKLKVMPEAGSLERARTIVSELRLKVMAFDAGDFVPEVIEVAKRAGVQIYVDRLGVADTPEVWQAAIDAGADGIQTDKPGQLVEFLRARGYRR